MPKPNKKERKKEIDEIERAIKLAKQEIKEWTKFLALAEQKLENLSP